MLRKRGTRSLAALAVAALLAGSPAAAATADRGGPAPGAQGLWSGLETLWSWVQAVFWAESDKGSFIDPIGATTESDKGSSIDPNG